MRALPPIGVMVPVAKLSPLPISRLNLAKNQIGGRFNPVSIPQVTLNISHFDSEKHHFIIVGTHDIYKFLVYEWQA